MANCSSIGGYKSDWWSQRRPPEGGERRFRGLKFPCARAWLCRASEVVGARSNDVELPLAGERDELREQRTH